MGVVYKAFHTDLEHFVAIKFPRFVAVPDRRSLARFVREAKLLGRLKHPHIVRALDAGKSPYGPYLVTEFIEGETLADFVSRTGPLTFETALQLTLQAAKALRFAHSQSVIHRDVKPTNMLLDQEGVLHVVDFGLAKLLKGDSTEDIASLSSDCTEDGTFLGTVGYAAPEQFRSNEPVDHRADIYALGCVLYFMLSGEPPHKGTLADRLISPRTSITAPSHLPNSNVSIGFEKLWQRMVANSPRHRFSSMSEVEKSLEAAMTDCRNGRLLTRSTRKIRLLLSTCLILGASLVLGSLYSSRIAPPQPTGPEPPRAIAPFSPDQAADYQKKWADYFAKSVSTVNSVGMPFMLIPPGEYIMGQSDAPISGPLPDPGDWRFRDPEIFEKEHTPQHRVVLTKPCYFGETEVTYSQFRQFVESTGYVTDAERTLSWGKEDKGWVKRSGYSWKNRGRWVSEDDHPVMNVSWNDAVALCAWLNSHDQLGKYRLPTEAEWEFACRAGSTTLYYFGNDPTELHEYAWVVTNSDDHIHQVGLKTPNPFGLHDLYGNRQEWCQDNYELTFYSRSPTQDPACKNGSDERVLRGGVHTDIKSFCTSARRWFQKSESVGAAGIRVVCEFEH